MTRLLDCMNERGIRTESDDFGPSTVIGDVIAGDSDGDFALMISYFQEVYRTNIGARRGGRAYRPSPGTEDFAFSVSDIPRAWQPYDVGPLEMEKEIRPRLSLAHVLASTEFVSSGSWEVPIFKDQGDAGMDLEPIAPGAPLPIVDIDVDEAQTKVHKVGYALRFPYEFFLNNRTTIQSVGFYQRWRAAKQEIALVNQGLNLATATGAATTRAIDTLDNAGVLDAHLSNEEDDLANLNVVVGNKESVIDYSLVDIHYSDGAPNPIIAPARLTFLDSIVGQVLVARKNDDNGSCARNNWNAEKVVHVRSLTND